MRCRRTLIEDLTKGPRVKVDLINGSWSHVDRRGRLREEMKRKMER